MALAMSVLLLIGVFMPSYVSTSLNGLRVNLFEMMQYSDHTCIYLIAIGVFSLVVSVFGFDIGVIFGGIGACAVNAIRFGRCFTAEYANVPVSLDFGFYILALSSVILLLSGFLHLSKKKNAK